MGVLKAIGSNVQNFVKHVLDFVKDVPNFVKDVPRVPKCVLRWGLTPNHFLMGSQMKLWTLGDTMGVPKAIGWDIPNFIKDVPNFVKNVQNFVKDVPRVPKYIRRWESAPNHFLKGS